MFLVSKFLEDNFDKMYTKFKNLVNFLATI